MTKEDMFYCLALSALIHGTNDAVKKTAKRLLPYASGSFSKSTLRPLAVSSEARAIILEEVLYPRHDLHVGTLWRDEYEYEIILQARDNDEYDVEEITTMVSQELLGRGIVTGRVYLSIRIPRSRRHVSTSVNMMDVTKSCLRAA